MRLCASACICDGLPPDTGAWVVVLGVVCDVVGCWVVVAAVVGVVAVEIDFGLLVFFLCLAVVFVVCSIAAVPLSPPPLESAAIAPAATSSAATSRATGIQRGKPRRLLVGGGATGGRRRGGAG